jgi:membrane associated rhomboid family serine protease
MPAAATCCGSTNASAVDGTPPPMQETLDVRFHAASKNWPANPFRFRGKGQLVFEPDFVFVRGTSHRALRFPKREEHRLRRADIVNAHTDGPDVFFHVLGVRENIVIGFSMPDEASARRVIALLPDRWTEAFALAHSERTAFNDRIDYWSSSTPVIWGLLTLNIGIYFLMWLARRSALGGLSLTSMLGWGWGSQTDAIIRSYQLVSWGSNVGQLTLGGQWWRLLTSMFLHGSLLHLLFNMVTLWQAGQLVERLFGTARFLALYVVAGLCGSLASVLWNPHVNSVGASGAIFGIIGGLLAFMQHKNSGVPPTVVKDLRGSLLPFLAFNLFAGYIYPHTDNAAHIGGLIGGWLAGHALARSLHVPGK